MIFTDPGGAPAPIQKAPEAECAFFKSRIELMRLDPSLHDEDKGRFIKELEGRIDSLAARLRDQQ